MSKTKARKHKSQYSKVMKINDEVSLEKDRYNFVVKYTTATDQDHHWAKKGGVQTESKYYPDLETACIAILRRTSMESTPKKMIKAYNDAKDEIIVAVRSLDTSVSQVEAVHG